MTSLVTPPRRDETGGIVEFMEPADLAGTQRENVNEFGCERASGLGDLARVPPEHEQPIP
jgi:hypothetical protein